MKPLIPLVAGLALLAGCSAPAEPDVEVPPPPATKSAPPSPTVSMATENQVASVVAGFEAEMREVAEGAFDCRYLNVMKPAEGTVDWLDLKSCYTRELTAGLNAQVGDRDLGELTPPPSMADLVTDTRFALQAIYNIELEEACGPPLAIPADTAECSSALGQRVSAYRDLVSELDKWGPYL